MNDNKPTNDEPIVVAVCISRGGVPKLPQPKVRVTRMGLVGDGHEHEKHNKASRAVSLLDEEIIQQLRSEGYDLVPGSIGENVTLRNVNVQDMSPGTILTFGQVRIRLEEPRKPCYVLDAVDPELKEDVIGRCGYMASVVEEGEITPGARVVGLGNGDSSKL